MAQEPPTTSPAGFDIRDAYFIVFRHKWKIVSCCVLGFLAAVAIYLLTPRTYVSQAKILVRFVADRNSLNPASQDERVRMPDPSGQTIINSEIEILTSRDLAEEVVRSIGSAEIYPSPKGQISSADAVELLLEGITAQVPARSSVIVLTFEHRNPAMAQRVLKLLIEKYTEKHMAIHRSLGAFEFLSAQTDRLRQQLLQTEADLRTLRTNAGVVSIDAAKTALAAEMTSLRNAILQDEANLAGRRALLTSVTPASTNTLTQTNVVTATSQRDFGFYQSICQSLNDLRSREIEMLGRYTENNPLLQAVRIQIADLMKQKSELEAANPAFVLATPVVGPENRNEAADPATQVPALQARITVLKSQFERLRAEAAALENAEGAIKDLERRRAVEEENYKAFSTSLEKARIDQAIDASKLSSVSVVQSASTSAPARQGRLKPVMMALAAGVGLGLFLAVFFEFIASPTIKRTADFKKTQLPLMLAIPALNDRGRRAKSFLHRNNAQNGDITHVESLPSISDQSHPLRPYFEAVRDRLLLQFEGNLRKPKLVGVTGCARGSGASSIAAGLAATISETGDGNVLLVDLNFDHGSAHQFFMGKPVCALQDAVEQQGRITGQVQENLYLASINGNYTDANGVAAVPSKKIAEIMPKLRASDYDYIIFDMPPISPTSITFRMSGLMDKVLLIVESERTHRDLLVQASGLLAQAKANAEAVLNRQQRYVPRFLEQELNGVVAN